jgi:tricorn protease
MRTLLIPTCLTLLAGAAVANNESPAGEPAPNQRTPHAGMTRFPAVSQSSIVFSYADDLWTVPRAGGMASPLASPLGRESNPRFSADGETIAFVGNYDGNSDLYSMPAAGGIPQRITYHPQYESLCGFTPSGDLLYHANGLSGLRAQRHLYTVPITGGLPQELPVPYGSFGAISPDGEWLAYSPRERVGRTWKRYEGGLASDLWLMNLKTGESKQLTQYSGTDVMPMWHGKTIYFLSDAGRKHRLNLWSIDTESMKRQQHTGFSDDIRWPSIGAGAIVFTVGSDLRLFDLATNSSRVVDIQIPGAQPQLRPKLVDASAFIDNGTWDSSPSAKRVSVAARGDIWTLPAKNGTPRNLTNTSGVAERHPAWSPDGRWIAYTSDADGAYEVYVTQSDGKGETRRLTTDGAAFRYALTWSPDSSMIAAVVTGGHLTIINVEDGSVVEVDQDPLAQYPAVLEASWSHDSSWLAYTKGGDEAWSASVHLYNVEGRSSHQVTSNYFNQSDVTFDRAGDFLYFVGVGNFEPTYSDLDSTWIYEESEVIHVVPLRADVEAPFSVQIDEQTWEEDSDRESEEDAEEDEAEAEGSDEDEDGDDDGEAAEEETEEPLQIDLEGFEHRAIRLPISPGNFRGLAVGKDGALVYSRYGDDEPSVMMFDVSADEPKEETVLSGVPGFGLTADGESIIYMKDAKIHLGKLSAGASGKPVATAGMDVLVDPRQEWAQLLRDASRIHKDMFYVKNMHGVDWDEVLIKYLGMLEHASSRRDVSDLIAEMVAELNVGHAYTSGGDTQGASNRNVGMLGCDFTLENGAYRISKIYEGGDWDSDARGPLSQPGIDVAVGDYLLAVNGKLLDITLDPWAAFLGMAGKPVVLSVSAKPSMDEEAREVTLKALRRENGLRYRSWIERNRRYVEENSDGQVGYVYVPNTGRDGQNDLIRQYYSQMHKKAVIIDERWNGGGQIPTRFVELLNRPVMNYFARRDGRDWKFPYAAHHGPKCMLINGNAGSGGDAFPAYFRKLGLGKLIGMRTWGGLVGISGAPALIDGARVTVPSFGYYEEDGTWGIEGYGVAPDIEVIDDPTMLMSGIDPQLDAAIELMLQEIETNGFQQPDRPSSPDRSGMGIPLQDR